MACHILGAPNLALQLGAPTSVECIQQGRPQRFHVPGEVGNPLRFSGARLHASGEAVLARRIEGYADRSPEFPRVNFWAICLDAPRPEARASTTPTPPCTGFVGDVFDFEKFQAVKNATEKRDPPARWQPVYRRQRHVDNRYLRRGHQAHSGGEDGATIHFPPEVLTRSPGHYRDWIRACKGGDPACSNFNVAVPFVEWMLLGVIALRVEGKLEWDAARMKFTNNSEANKYLKPTFRKGWSLT